MSRSRSSASAALHELGVTDAIDRAARSSRDYLCLWVPPGCVLEKLVEREPEFLHGSVAHRNFRLWRSRKFST
jgi:hypothetical protein